MEGQAGGGGCQCQWKQGMKKVEQCSAPGEGVALGGGGRRGRR
jgi:hypothetical protein